MLKNEMYYEKEDIKGMLQSEDINGDEMQGEYFAIGSNGKAYKATFVNKYIPGGVFFFVIPDYVRIIGYVPA